MNNKYLEVRDTTMDLKRIIGGTDSVGKLHFDMLEVPLNKGSHN